MISGPFFVETLVAVALRMTGFGPGSGTLLGTLATMPKVRCVATHQRFRVTSDRQDLAGCNASHYNCSARIGGGFRG